MDSFMRDMMAMEGSGMDSFVSFMMAIMGFVMIILVIVLVVEVTMYILRSLGLHAIASKRGLQNPWICWIPIIGWFTLGAITDDINRQEGSTTYFRWILLGGSILGFVLPYAMGFGDMLRMLFNMLQDPYYYGYYGYGYDYGYMSAMNGASSLVSLAFLVITLICLHKVFKCYHPQSSTLWIVLCVFFGFLRSIFLFVVRNNQPNWINPPQQGGYYGNAPGAGESWQQQTGYYNAPPAGEPWNQPNQNPQQNPGSYDPYQRPEDRDDPNRPTQL